MERAKYFILIFMLFGASVTAQTDYKTEIYNAFINNNMPKWKTTIDKMNLQRTKTNDFILELLNYQYGYIAWCIGNDYTNVAETYLEMATKNVENLEEQSFKLSYVNSYKSALYGFEIGLAWYKAPFLGPESITFAETAMNLDKTNPFGFIQYANAQYYMPETFGGSKTLALEYYIKALLIMEDDENYTTKNWNYISLLTTIAQAYTETGNYKSAKDYYEKILKLEPNYSWVKNELYPELLKKL